MTDSFTNVFGGSPVQTSEVRYQAIALTGNISLFWPQQGVDTSSVIARWNDVTPSGPGFNITFPDATTISTGQDAVFTNKGSNPYNVLASDSTTIATVNPSTAMYIINSDNSTPAGAWQLTIFGGTASQVNAAALAGDGLIAQNGQLSPNFPVIPISSNYVSTSADLANVLNWTGGAGTITLNAAGESGQGWFCEIRNSGTGSVVVSPPTGTIDGASSKTYAQTESSLVHTDGVNYYTVGYGRAVTSTFTRLVVSVAGNTNVTLTSAQAQNQMLEFTGALTGNIVVNVPANVAEYFVYNHTTGAFTLTFGATGGTGAIVIQSQRRIAVCDGTNVSFADTLGTGTVTQVNTGTGLTGGPITTTGTVALANTGVSSGSYTLLAATVNAQGQLTAASSGSLDIIGNVQGDILYRNASVWTALTPGLLGQFLKSGGAGANVSWASVLGTVLNVRAIFTTGTYVPTTGTSNILGFLIGGGGAGGGAAATPAGEVSVGSGGGGGELRVFYMANPGSVTLTIGAGGVAVSGTTGGNGGNTIYNGVTAVGGLGGLTSGPSASAFFANSAGQAVGSGGIWGSGTSRGWPGFYIVGPASAPAIAYGGAGGDSVLGMGAGGGRFGSGATGNPGVGPGGGGSGAFNIQSSAAIPGGTGFFGGAIMIDLS